MIWSMFTRKNEEVRPRKMPQRGYFFVDSKVI